MPKGCSRSVRLFARDFKHWLNHEGWKFLPEEYASWTAGGCWLLARALHQWVGDPAELWTIYSEVGSDVLRPDVIPQHVVVRIGNCYLDGNGAWTEKQLLDYWETKEGLRYPELRPMNVEDLEEAALECPVEFLKELVKAIDLVFSPGFLD
jgi:hypothetical protein